MINKIKIKTIIAVKIIVLCKIRVKRAIKHAKINISQNCKALEKISNISRWLLMGYKRLNKFSFKNLNKKFYLCKYKYPKKLINAENFNLN